MTLRLNGATSGFTEIDAPAVAGSNTLVLPGGNGSADQALVTNGSGTLSFADRGRMVLETAQSATGTEVDFTSIPSWVKRITVMFDGVSLNGGSNVLVQLGDSGGIETTGYESSSTGGASTVASVASTAGIIAFFGDAAGVQSGHLLLANVSANIWSSSHVLGRSDIAASRFGGGRKTLSGTLDRVRITTVNGTNTFDAGTINLLLEG